ncbi:hypothetical protein GCK72_023206 [Caenorhabditis remanei]|uniref:Uncharacterized protein n=1 Tax=Caenorhabditis remanei TaxID=31234 RepID=A0A6A5FWG4_CAERE|nr:hypothetical protein GCK72_023206 [Caenorhabditis remanei]KAF1746749.1 hypothetical protein GCK72_023206 [Caenorhabditis remanei]
MTSSSSFPVKNRAFSDSHYDFTVPPQAVIHNIGNVNDQPLLPGLGQLLALAMFQIPLPNSTQITSEPQNVRTTNIARIWKSIPNQSDDSRYYGDPG